MRNDAKYSSKVNKNRKQLPSQTKDNEYYDLSIKFKNQNKVIKITRNSNPTKMSFDLCKENDLDYKDLEDIKSQIENAISNLKDNSTPQSNKTKTNLNTKNYKFANLNFNNSTTKSMKDDKSIENKPQKNKIKNKNNLQINTNTNTISNNAYYQSINSNNKNTIHDENDQVLSPINRLSKYNNTITSSNNTLRKNNNDVKYNNYFTETNPNSINSNSLINTMSNNTNVKPLNFKTISTNKSPLTNVNNSNNNINTINNNNINTINTINIHNTRNQNPSHYQQSQKLFLCDYKIQENKSKKSNSCTKYPSSNTITKSNNSMNINTLSSNRNNYTLLTENKNINNTLSICKSSNSVSRKRDIFSRLYKDSQIKRITYRRPCHFSKTVANRGNGNLNNINRSFREIYNNNNSINTINFLNELMSDNYNNSYMLKNNSLNKYSFQPNEYKSRKNSLSPGKSVENEEYGYHHKKNSTYSNSIHNMNNYKPVINHGQSNLNQNYISNYCLTTVDSKNSYKPLRDRLSCISQEENLCLKETRAVVFKNLFNDLINDSNCGVLNKNTICLDFIPFEIQDELKVIIYDVVQKNKSFNFDEFCNAMNDLFNNMNFDKRRSIVNKYKFRINSGGEDKYKFNNYYNDYHTGRNRNNTNYNGVNTFNNGGYNGNYQSFLNNNTSASKGGSRRINSKSKENNKNPYAKRNFYYIFS